MKCVMSACDALGKGLNVCYDGTVVFSFAMLCQCCEASLHRFQLKEAASMNCVAK